MKIKSVTINGFRGFNEKRTISLNNNIVIIYGLNGSGKSSLTEALEWLFFGEISRQRLSRCKSEYQYEDYLTNLFYQGKENPFVEVEGTINGKEFKLKKELLHDSCKYYVNDKEAKSFAGLGLRLENYFRPMLAQTEIKALVDSEPKDRWEQLSCILGQDELSKLRDNLMTLKNNKRDSLYKSQQSLHQSLVNELNDKDQLDLKKYLADLNINGVTDSLKKLNKVDDKLLENIKKKQSDLMNTELGKRAAEINYKNSQELTDFLTNLKKQFNRVETDAKSATKDGIDHNYLAFLDQGKKFLNKSKCPYCLEQSLTNKRLEIIAKQLVDGAESQNAKKSFDNNIESLENLIKSFELDVTDYLINQRELKILAQKFGEINETKIAADIQNIDNSIKTAITEFTNFIEGFLEKYKEFINRKYFHKDKVYNSGLEDLDTKMIAFIKLVTDCNTKWLGVKTEITNKYVTNGVSNEEFIKELILYEKVINFITTNSSYITTTKKIKIIDSLTTKLEQFEKLEVNRLLSEHAGEIKNYYKKMNPNGKIEFKSIDVKTGSRRQASLKAQAFGKVVNPVTFFSEANTNSLALSIYFPQRVDRNNTWESVILDDPVQSMDENYSQALIEILSETSKKKQIIVLVHAKSFSNRLKARFAHLKPLMYDFYSNDEKGPKINLNQGETKEYLRVIEEFLSKGDPSSLKSGSHSLREAIESVCIDFLLNKGVGFSTAQKIQKDDGLKGLFSESSKKGLPEENISKLKSLLITTHDNSHAWSMRDATIATTKVGVEYIQEIIKIM